MKYYKEFLKTYHGHGYCHVLVIPKSNHQGTKTFGIAFSFVTTLSIGWLVSVIIKHFLPRTRRKFFD